MQIEVIVDEAQSVFQGLFEASPDALVVVDTEGRIALANRQTEKAFGYSRLELIGQSMDCLLVERLRNSHLQQRLLYQDAPHQLSMGTALALIGRRRDGSEFPLDILLRPVHSSSGKQILAAVRDTTERDATLAALHEARERGRVTLESIGDAVLSIDTDGKLDYLNKGAEQMVGWSRDEALGRPLAQIFQIGEHNARDTVLVPLEHAIRENPDLGMTRLSVLSHRDGSEVSIEYTVAPIRDKAGKATGMMVVFRDISKTREMAHQMAYLAQHDFLTNLPNRMLLSDRLTQAIGSAERNGAQLAVLFLDLDHFKHINDSLGHGIGDRLLESVAKRLAACVRRSDTVSRVGGDEFVILLAEIEHADDAAISARKLIDALGGTHQIAGHALQVSTSIGISVYPYHGQDAETLVKNADLAMYHAKDSGRNNFQFFTPDMDLRSVERQAIESGLRHALDHGEFELYYQPKVDLATGAVIGAEALIRWQHPQRGLISPAHFIPIAEDSGLIVPIGRWVMQAACRQMQAWRKIGAPLVSVSVNISALDFRSRHFLDNVRAILADTQVEPHYLELELTESVLMQHAEAAICLLDELKGIGVRLSVDDFGTGYSSLSYLRHFPIDVVKIDQSFLHEITTRADNAAIVSAVIGMCEGLQCAVIAEGVETAEQAAFLLARRCAQGQGYLFGRPMPADDFAKQLSRKREGPPSSPPVRPQLADRRQCQRRCTARSATR